MASDRVIGAVSQIMDAILDKRFSPGDPLPPETELAQWLGVSRPTMREAVRSLAERGVLRVVHGRGTFVADPHTWRDPRSIITWMSRNCSRRQLGIHLVETRRMIEVGASGLAAARRTDLQIADMRQILDAYAQASAENDVERATQLDLDFHNSIMSASGNPLLAALLDPLAEALLDSRRHTTEFPEVRKRAAGHHENIFAKIAANDPTAAKQAMRAHMDQTRDDILTLLKG